jgi:hypothetical protein
VAASGGDPIPTFFVVVVVVRVCFDGERGRAGLCVSAGRIGGSFGGLVAASLGHDAAEAQKVACRGRFALLLPIRMFDKI